MNKINILIYILKLKYNKEDMTRVFEKHINMQILINL